MVFARHFSTDAGVEASVNVCRPSPPVSTAGSERLFPGAPILCRAGEAHPRFRCLGPCAC
jgi:hypothetical protein